MVAYALTGFPNFDQITSALVPTIMTKWQRGGKIEVLELGPAKVDMLLLAGM